MTQLPDIRDADVGGKRVLVRADLNVTFNPGTTVIADDTRIRATLPTLELLHERGAIAILATHVGRPRGRWNAELTVEPVRKRASELLGREVVYAGRAGNESCRKVIESLQPGDIAILENLRFHPGEEVNDHAFAEELAGLADIYVNDAFGASHRAHASFVGLPALMRQRYAGLLLIDEIDALNRAMDPTDGLAVAVVGGAKADGKIELIRNLARHFDWILVGGGMVKAFVDGRAERATSLNPEAEVARELWLDDALRPKLIMPTCVKIAREFAPGSEYQCVNPFEANGSDGYILDIDGETIDNYASILSSASKVVWNGPMGVFEWPHFSGGTRAVADAIASNRSAFTLAGGGSTADAIAKFGVADEFTHVSTGGGATLEFLEGKTLPGIAALARST